MVKNNKIDLRLSDKETEVIGQKAERLNMSIGIFLRFIGMNVDFEIKSRLNNNVRQILDKPFKKEKIS